MTKTWMSEFQKSIVELRKKKRVEPILKKAQIDAMESQIEELKDQIKVYELLKTLPLQKIVMPFFGLNQFMEQLIKARIVRKLTQAQLADNLGVHQQQVQRWEDMDYEKLTISSLRRIMQVLGVEITGVVKLKGVKTTAR